MDPKTGTGRPPIFGGITSANANLFHCNRKLDEDRQNFMRNLHNQTMTNVPCNRRSSTGVLSGAHPYGKSFSSYSRFKRLHKLHYESMGIGLNDVNNYCLQNLYSQNRSHGLIFRASLPATPISTPVHKDFQPFSEQLLFDRLCRTPSPARRPASGQDLNNNSVNRDPRLDGRITSGPNKEDANAFEPFDVDDLSQSDIGTDKGLRLVLHLNSKSK